MKGTKGVFLTIILVSISLSSARAEGNGEVSIKHQTALSSVQGGTGIVILPSKILEKPLKKLSPQEVGVPVSLAEEEERAIAAPLFTLENGNLEAPPFQRVIFSSQPALPLCGYSSLNEAAAADKRGPLQSLVSVRESRRKLAFNKLKAFLTEDTLTQLNELEKRFGLEKEPPLSLNLSPYELEERIWRILGALSTYDAFSRTEKDS